MLFICFSGKLLHSFNDTLPSVSLFQSSPLFYFWPFYLRRLEQVLQDAGHFNMLCSCMARQGTECLNTAPGKHNTFSGCLGILARRCVFNKKLHRTEFISFPLLMSTRGILPEEGLLDKPFSPGIHSIWKSHK